MDQTQQGESKKPKSLQLSGLSYLLGDAAMFASGMLASMANNVDKAGTRKKAFTGALWGFGGAAAAYYGNPSADKKLEIFAHKLEKHLNDHGAIVSDATREHIDLLRGKHGVFHQIDRFLYEHPSEALNVVFAVGAGALLSSGDKTRMMIGGLVGAGALAGLLIKEDKNAPDKAKHGNVAQKALAWAQEKPLRVSGAFYFANNFFTIQDGINDYKKFKNQHFVAGLKPHYFTFLTAASYILANGLLFMSPRGQIDQQHLATDDVVKLEQVAAEIIAAQPKANREALLQEVSKFLTKEKAVPIPVEHLAAQLNERVDHIAQRRIDAVAERGWRNRHEAQRRAQENQSLAK